MFGFSRFDGLLRFFLWAVWEHHLETGKGLPPLVSALVVFPNDSCRGAMPMLLPLFVERASEELEKLAATNRQQNHGKGAKATHSAKLEMRVWQWVFRREKMRGSPQENVKALSKMWNTK